MIAERLKDILATEGEEISALLQVLSQQETIKLHRYFEATTKQTQNEDDIRIKFFALNALFVYIKNNPSVEQELQEKNSDIENLAFKIYELSIILYEVEKSWEHYFYVSSYAVLADKQTLLTKENELPKPEGILEKVLQFFIDFSLPVDSKGKLEQRQSNLSALKQDFSDIQKPKNIQSQAQLYEIVAVSNLVGLGEKLQTYLLKGDGQNISTSINNEVAKAIKVFAESNNHQWELICGLLRFVLQKHYKNAIWTAANHRPFFKEFVEKQLQQDSFLLSLFPSQKAALQDIITSHKSTVISMPTSSGKTLLAELKILYTRSLYQNNCLCAYVVPTNALVNQTLKRLKTSFPDLKVAQLLPYNHFDKLEEELIGTQPDILVSTPEKLNFLLKNEESNILDGLRLIVVDEAHNISDPNRGSIWEFLLANLKQSDERLSYLLLTPFIKNKDELAKWLGNDSHVAKSIEWTPTKQYVAYHSLESKKKKSKINYLPSAGNAILKEEVSIDLAINPQQRKSALGIESVNDVVRNSILVEKYSRQQGCILILHRGTDSAEKLAGKIADFLPDTTAQAGQLDYAKEVIRQELGEDYPLLTLLDKGVAFHHSRLSPLVKEVIENLVSENTINILVATTTLAQGMNFPIKTVIFETTTLGGGKDIKELTHSDFWNIAGRAGRAYKDTEGHIILGYKGNNKKTKEKLESFIKQDIETTISSLKAFFDAIENDQTIDYSFIKDRPVAQNFLHYLNHLMNISFQYQLERVKRQDITDLLANSLYFKQNEFAEGFLETQEKVVNFSNQYLALIKKKEVGQLKLADTLGITDISLSTIIGITQDHRPLLSECLNQNNKEDLAVIINAIHKIPELKINLGRDTGQFNSTLVAGILLDWINGINISTIANNQGIEINECAGYIFSRLKNYIPWGMAIYQKISNDENELLPSYAFYGVKDEKAVKLSYIGVPRFALGKMKELISDELYQDISKLKQHIKKQNFFLEEKPAKNDIVNDIIKKSVI